MVKREDTERYEGACRALYAREISDAQFLATTAKQWRGTAFYLFDHWKRKLPAWVEPQDVEQELVLLVLKNVRAWLPGRSQGTIGQFVTWGAIHRMQRKLDHWRGASTHGSSGKNPSRAEINFSRAFSPDADVDLKIGAEQPSQDAAVEAGEEFETALESCKSVREALVLLALKHAEGSVRSAATLLYANYGARVECGLADEEHARRVVGESISYIARRTGGPAEAPPEDLFADETNEDAASAA